MKRLIRKPEMMAIYGYKGRSAFQEAIDRYKQGNKVHGVPPPDHFMSRTAPCWFSETVEAHQDFLRDNRLPSPPQFPETTTPRRRRTSPTAITA